MRDFCDESAGRCDHGDECVGVEKVQDAAGGDLEEGGGCVRSGERGGGGGKEGGGGTFPPPTTRTRRLRTCQARRREPPGWTAGNSAGGCSIGQTGYIYYTRCARDVYRDIYVFYKEKGVNESGKESGAGVRREPRWGSGDARQAIAGSRSAPIYIHCRITSPPPPTSHLTSAQLHTTPPPPPPLPQLQHCFRTRQS